ncbi:MAG: hypothetical protein M1838_001639 [Thelocarpon superellum]|nr:MAG: hypothetical protein M1838_001639 [Thelocarpon superellum]
MASLNKRQQARNERAIQDLIRSVPGNDRCADCQAKNPGWASWSLGIFLCMRCAALHRKLGTHISKVKSLSMDTWTNDQVENMKRVGNTSSNLRFNPHHSTPSIPLDVDEVDAAMERFIRQKYEQQLLHRPNASLANRQNTGSTSSEEPPPLPPKPTQRFGLGTRAASATFPATDRSRGGYGSSPSSPDRNRFNARAPSPALRNKQSRVFGASVGGSGDSLESKVATLRDMGFIDEKRNASVLKGLNGNLERSIETLVRLSDGTMTHVTTTSDVVARAFDGPRSAEVGNNPFQRRATEPDLAQAAQTPMTAPPSYAAPQSYSMQSSTQPSLEQSFQDLRVSQPLFPNATGGFPAQYYQPAPHQQLLAPPVPSVPQQFTQPGLSSANGQQLGPMMNPSYNPFLSQQSAPPTQSTFNGDVHLLAPQHQAMMQQQQHQQQQQQLQQQQHHQQQEYQQQQLQQQQQQQQQQQFMTYQLSSQRQPMHFQPPERADKSSIMALYNYPQLAPTTLAPAPAGLRSSSGLDAVSPVPTTQAHTLASGQSQRSVSSPMGALAGNRNPFLTNATNASHQSAVAGAQASGILRHGSQESVDLGGWQQGRHSPDAFASLSARSVR